MHHGRAALPAAAKNTSLEQVDSLLRFIVNVDKQHLVPQFQFRILPRFIPRRIGQVEFQSASGLLDVPGPSCTNQPARKVCVLGLFLAFRLSILGIGFLIDSLQLEHFHHSF